MSTKSSLEMLIKKIKSRKATICVIGLDRVGLPLASVLANSGLNVLGIDVDKKN